VGWGVGGWGVGEGLHRSNNSRCSRPEHQCALLPSPERRLPGGAKARQQAGGRPWTGAGAQCSRGRQQAAPRTPGRRSPTAMARRCRSPTSSCRRTRASGRAQRGPAPWHHHGHHHRHHHNPPHHHCRQRRLLGRPRPGGLRTRGPWAWPCQLRWEVCPWGAPLVMLGATGVSRICVRGWAAGQAEACVGLDPLGLCQCFDHAWHGHAAPMNAASRPHPHRRSAHEW